MHRALGIIPREDQKRRKQEASNKRSNNKCYLKDEQRSGQSVCLYVGCRYGPYLEVMFDISGADSNSIIAIAYPRNRHIQSFKTQRGATKTYQS